MTQQQQASADSSGYFPTLILLTISVLALSGFFLYQAMSERGSLLATLAAQEKSLEQAQHVKERLDSLASATAKLADEGDPGAQAIIKGMKNLGISVRPSGN